LGICRQLLPDFVGICHCLSEFAVGCRESATDNSQNSPLVIGICHSLPEFNLKQMENHFFVFLNVGILVSLV
jgi:hypothetical protein